MKPHLNGIFQGSGALGIESFVVFNDIMQVWELTNTRGRL